MYLTDIWKIAIFRIYINKILIGQYHVENARKFPITGMHLNETQMFLKISKNGHQSEIQCTNNNRKKYTSSCPSYLMWMSRVTSIPSVRVRAPKSIWTRLVTWKSILETKNEQSGTTTQYIRRNWRYKPFEFWMGHIISKTPVDVRLPNSTFNEMCHKKSEAEQRHLHL